MEQDTKHELLKRQNRAVTCDVREASRDDRTLTFVASTEDVARDGDIIRADGWMLDEFLKNPVFLWAHNYDVPPIGKITGTRKVTTPNPALEIDVKFAEHELAENVYTLYRDGFMAAVSVGFLVRAYAKPTDDEREALGLKEWGIIVTAAELLEVSAVPVPSDPGALMKAGREAREAVAVMCRSLPEDERQAWAIEDTDTTTSNSAYQIRKALEDIRDEIADLRTEVQRLGRAAPDEGSITPEPDEVSEPYGLGDAIRAVLSKRKESH
jgi:HK97 family phage prohead protease